MQRQARGWRAAAVARLRCTWTQTPLLPPALFTLSRVKWSLSLSLSLSHSLTHSLSVSLPFSVILPPHSLSFLLSLYHAAQCTHTRMQSQARPPVRPSARTHARTHARTYACARTHTHTHKHAHTRTHIRTNEHYET